ncbi:hypothetical protein DBV15_08952 [Temnothorax longispinosus]|uniref:Uncharacterized protein n=1 Tax=Temnothorax longispinosus TaxID=300112 RepID=A0A4S2JA78_9HYME|nr:hypothetical protein DBV15_08952 [Temnothorax longispinosus]
MPMGIDFGLNNNFDKVHIPKSSIGYPADKRRKKERMCQKVQLKKRSDLQRAKMLFTWRQDGCRRMEYLFTSYRAALD